MNSMAFDITNPLSPIAMPYVRFSSIPPHMNFTISFGICMNLYDMAFTFFILEVRCHITDFKKNF